MVSMVTVRQAGRVLHQEMQLQYRFSSWLYHNDPSNLTRQMQISLIGRGHNA